MMAKSDQGTEVTVQQQVKTVAMMLGEIPTNAPQSDMARALDELATVDKAVRRLRASLTASLVLAARQMSL